MDVPEIKVCGICGGILLRRDRSHGPANCPTVFKMDIPEKKVCSTKILDTRGKEKEENEKSARRAIQKREMGHINVTLNDPAVVVTGTILGPNPGEEKQIIYYDDGQ